MIKKVNRWKERREEGEGEGRECKGKRNSWKEEESIREKKKNWKKNRRKDRRKEKNRNRIRKENIEEENEERK